MRRVPPEALRLLLELLRELARVPFELARVLFAVLRLRLEVPRLLAALRLRLAVLRDPELRVPLEVVPRDASALEATALAVFFAAEPAARAAVLVSRRALPAERFA